MLVCALLYDLVVCGQSIRTRLFFSRGKGTALSSEAVILTVAIAVILAKWRGTPI